MSDRLGIATFEQAEKIYDLAKEDTTLRTNTAVVRALLESTK